MSVEQLAAASNETHADIVRRWVRSARGIGSVEAGARPLPSFVVSLTSRHVTVTHHSVREMLSSYEDPTIMFQLQKV